MMAPQAGLEPATL